MTIERGKRRTKGQKIGDKGEAVAKVWAIENGLNPTKFENDYGIDLFCQVLKKTPETEEEITGEVLAIQVRAVFGKKRKCIKLDRVDAENSLRIHTPFCFIGIEDSSSKVYFRFLDLNLLNELHLFLGSDHKTHKIEVIEFSSKKNTFRTQFEKSINLGFQQRLRWQKAHLDIKAVIPGGGLEVKQSKKGSIAIVNAPWITSMFKVDPNTQKEAGSYFFEKGELPPSGTKGLVLRPEVTHITNLIDGPTFLAGGLESDTTLFLNGPNGFKDTVVKYRILGDEIACITKTGLLLIMSKRRRIRGKWYHELRTSITDVDVLSLGHPNSDIEFLKELKEGRSIGLDKEQLIPIDRWKNLELLGSDVECLERACNFLGIDLKEIYLKDLMDEELLSICDLITALLDEVPLDTFMPSFIIGPPTENEYSDNNWIPAGFRVPIVANFKEKGVVFWIEGEGQVYLHTSGEICGFRAVTKSKATTKKQPKRFSKSNKPELWLYPDWPPIPLFTPAGDIPKNFKREKILELGGDIWPTGNT